MGMAIDPHSFLFWQDSSRHRPEKAREAAVVPSCLNAFFTAAQFTMGIKRKCWPDGTPRPITRARCTNSQAQGVPDTQAVRGAHLSIMLNGQGRFRRGALISLYRVECVWKTSQESS